jgi:hypothetical protein
MVPIFRPPSYRARRHHVIAQLGHQGCGLQLLEHVEIVVFLFAIGAEADRNASGAHRLDRRIPLASFMLEIGLCDTDAGVSAMNAISSSDQPDGMGQKGKRRVEKAKIGKRHHRGLAVAFVEFIRPQSALRSSGC